MKSKKSAKRAAVSAKPRWFVYMLECADKSLYTGITTDTKRRVAEHNAAMKGAKYTRARRPVKLRYAEPARSRSAASVREAAIKKLQRREKLALIRNPQPE